MAFDTDTAPMLFAGPCQGIAVKGLAINGVASSGTQDLASLLFTLIPQWPVMPPPAAGVQGCDGHVAPGEIIIRAEAGQWRISSPHVALSDFDLDDGYMAANALIGALIAAYVAQDDSLVSIHAGAARVGDGLVLLLGDNGAGKSTFATTLAARGQRFFADDRLIVDLAPAVPIGHSLAIAPKLRLPLPPDSEATYRDFVADNSILNWPEMAVLRPGPAQAAGFGERLPLKALIHLRREPGSGTPALTAMRQPDMVRLLLEQLFAPHLSQQGELSACVRLAQAVGIWELRYSSAWPATEAVIAQFNGVGNR